MVDDPKHFADHIFHIEGFADVTVCLTCFGNNFNIVSGRQDNNRYILEYAHFFKLAAKAVPGLAVDKLIKQDDIRGKGNDYGKFFGLRNAQGFETLFLQNKLHDMPDILVVLYDQYSLFQAPLIWSKDKKN